MTITLNLNNRQVTMLHAIFGGVSTQQIVNTVLEQYRNYLDTTPDDPICTAYKRTATFIDNCDLNHPLGNEELELFNLLEDAMRTMGRNLNNTEVISNA